jgi:hypothetical protein
MKSNFQAFIFQPALCMGLVIFAHPQALAQNTSIRDSVYTSISRTDCVPFEFDDESDYVASHCPGRAGVKVDFIYSDAREDLELSTQDAGHMRLGLPNVIGGFNSLPSSKLEWRGYLNSDGSFQTYALIVRTKAYLPDQSTKEALAVFRFTPFEICYVGKVDSRLSQNGLNSNQLARKLADEVAVTFPCGPN